MNVTRIVTSVVRKVDMARPELYLGGAIIAGVASVVLIAKAHKKSDQVLGPVAEELEDVKAELAEIDPEEEELIHDYNKMRYSLYRAYLFGAARLYGPGIAVGATSVVLVLASHGLMRSRTKALLSTVTLLEAGFREYRKRVVNEFGEEVDQRLYFGAEERGVTTLEKDEDGKATKRKGKQNHLGENPSPLIYSRIFDETNRNWSHDPDMNEFFLRAVQSQMDDKLHIQGYVLLNTVYQALGFAESPEGAVVGWSKKAPGDNFISFGLDADINQRDDSRYALDFNVNGVVFEMIGA